MPTRSRVPPVMMTTRGYERIVSTRENRDYRAHTNASKILLNSFLNEAMRNMPELARGRIQSAAHSTQATRALGRRPEDVAPPRAGHPAWPGGRSGLRVCSAGPVHRGWFAVKRRARAAETAQRELDGTAAARRLSLPQSRPRLALRSGPARPGRALPLPEDAGSPRPMSQPGLGPPQGTSAGCRPGRGAQRRLWRRPGPLLPSLSRICLRRAPPPRPSPCGPAGAPFSNSPQSAPSQ